MSSVAEAIRQHHRDLLQAIREQAQALSEGHGDAQTLMHLLKHDLLPHAQGEERALYPAIDPLIARYGHPSAPMSIDHEFISDYITRIEQALPDRELLLRLVWQLYALLEAHIAKEERVLLPLLEAHLPESEQQRLLDAMHEQP